MDTNPSTLHDYFPRASGSNLLPVSPRRPHPSSSPHPPHAAAASSTLAPRTEPYSTPFPVPSYLQHASLYKDQFATGSSLSSSSQPALAPRVGEPLRDSSKGKRPSYTAAATQPEDNKTADPVLLPTAWNPDDRCALLDLTSDALGVSFAGSAKNGDRDAAAVRTNRPVPSQAAVYYFEVKILDKGVSGYIGIGLCHKTVSLSRLPGWEDKSYGYHADDGRAFCCQGTGEPFGPTFTTGDIVGCGIDWTDAGPPRGPRERTGNKARDRAERNSAAAGGADKDRDKLAGGRVFFTKNGQFIGYAFCNLQGPLYPTVGLRTPNEAVRANFGTEPFAFDIESLVLERKRTVLAQLSQLPAPSSSSSPSHFLPSPIADSVPPVPALLPPSDRQRLHETIQALVASYLTHHGYVDTAESFLSQLREERVERARGLNGASTTAASAAASAGSSSSSALASESMTNSSTLRAEIRAAALSGTASGAQRALDLVEQHFPSLLDTSSSSSPTSSKGEGALTAAEEGKSIGFWLRCRVFVEAVLEWSRANRDPAGMAELAMEQEETTAATAPIPLTAAGTAGHGDVVVVDEDADMLSASTVLDGAAAAAAEPSAAPPLTLDSILSLGQSLHATYSSDPDPRVREELQAVLGLMAYRDPEKEATGRTRELLSKAERENVADELNKAILRAAGLPPVPALEALFRQAAASIRLAGDLGSGSAALIDVKSMFSASPKAVSTTSFRQA
ncbi:SPRY-domain-containing protein [Rhodotorula sp. JG-1b]|nr:SPRY-domain-containing protein [Rhodotorula sp. JG-1b]